MAWTTPDNGLEIYNNGGFNMKYAMAAFDMDGTLIKTRSGKKFPIDSEDWQWISSDLLTKLKSIQNSHSIVILTNQSKFNDELRKKIVSICSLLEIPVLVLVSTGYTKYRKPMRGFIDYLETNYDFSLTDSYFVGDAIDNTLDHSNCDFYFALNARLQFHYAHHYFNTGDPKYSKRLLPPPKLPLFNSKPDNITKFQTYEIIILVGPPAIGKSHFTKMMEGWTSISADKYKTKPKYNKALGLLLKSSHKIILDNTHPSRKSREELITLIKSVRPNANICILEISPGHDQRSIAEYLNYERCYNGGTWISAIVYNVYYKNYTDVQSDTDLADVHSFTPVYNGLAMYY